MNGAFGMVLLTAVLVGTLLVAGCAWDIPLTEEKMRGMYPAMTARFGLEPTIYKANLGHTIKTTSVHPDDTWLFSGETSTDPSNCYLQQNKPSSGLFPGNRVNWAPNAGLFASYGTKELRVVGGLSARLNMMHSRDSTREGLYSMAKQVNDTRPNSEASFVFTQVIPGAMTVTPSVGLESNIGLWSLGAEVGFPFQEWIVRSGHDMPDYFYYYYYGIIRRRWEVAQRDSWMGFGVRYAGKVGYRMSDTVTLFLSAFYEEYPWAKFKGETAHISGVGCIGGIAWHW